ncbi:NAD(P)-dependent oxidoreductase [Variovorax paradoxus]|nr:NAD(P)-dependent oxidoreductase [Variovorax paradoxus]
MKIGFVGLGRMGQGMAANLVKGGASLLVFDTNPQAIDTMAQLGAEPAGSVAEAARQVDVMFTSLPGPAQVEEVVLGARGVLANMKPGLVLFEMSTSSVALNRRMYDAFKSKGGSMLDAPVSGQPAGAASGELAVWVGGDEEVFERHLDLLRRFSKNPFRVGDIGAGTVAKLVHNMTAFTVLLTMAEAFTVGTKAGVEPLRLWEALRMGVIGKQGPLNMLTNQFLPGKYDPPGFLQKLAHKDMRLATDLAKEVGVPVRLASMTLEEMTEALSRGWGEGDSRSYLKLQLERAGVEMAVDPRRIQEALQRQMP